MDKRHAFSFGSVPFGVDCRRFSHRLAESGHLSVGFRARNIDGRRFLGAVMRIISGGLGFKTRQLARGNLRRAILAGGVAAVDGTIFAARLVARWSGQIDVRTWIQLVINQCCGFGNTPFFQPQRAQKSQRNTKEHKENEELASNSTTFSNYFVFLCDFCALCG